MTELVLGEALAALIDHRGKTPKKLGGDFSDVGVPVVSAMLIKNGRVLIDNARRIPVEMYRRWMPVAVQRYDVLLTSEAPLGECAILQTDEPLALGQRVFGLRGRPGVLDSRYLFYALQHDDVKADLHSRATGTTVVGIRQAELLKVKVPAPSYIEQIKIGAALGALDDKIAVNDHIKYVANELAKAYYWDECGRWSDVSEISLGEAARWFSGGTPSTGEPSYWNGEVPWISAASLRSNWIDSSDRAVTQLGVKNGTRVVPRNAILFVVRGMSLKSELRVGIAQRDVAFGQDCKALVAIDGIEPIYLFYSILCRVDQILALVDEAGHGTGRLATDRLAALQIASPRAIEQQRLVNKLRPLAGLAAARQREKRALVELRDSLLPKLISGELRVRDAERQVSDVV